MGLSKSGHRGSAHLLAALWRGHPRRALLVVSLLVLAGLFEGAGVLSLLPLLGELTRGDGADSPVAESVVRVLGAVGLSPSVGILLGMLVLGVTAKAMLSLAAETQAGFAAADLTTDLRVQLVSALVRARWQHFTERPVGSFANAVSGEATRAAATFTVAANLLAGIVQVLVYGILATATAGVAVLLAAAGGAVLFSSLHRLVRVARESGLDQTVILKRLVARLTDGLASIKAIKAMAREAEFEAIIAREANDLNTAQRRHVRSSAALPALQEPLIIGLMAIGIYVLVRSFDMPLHELLFLAFLFQRVVTRLGGLQVSLQKLVGPASAYWSLVDTIQAARRDEESEAAGEAPHLRTAIRFEGVHFSYDETPVLSDLSFVIPARKLTALVGPSGGGKTTIIDLVVGLLAPQEGRIWIDDTALDQVPPRAWRERIGYVPQDVLLLNDSVFMNVTLGDPSLGEEEARAALEAAEAWPFVAALPLGLDTNIGERGSKLSGGQRQRMALARALVRKPDLLVLDEATTALDPASEAAVCETLRRLSDRVTILAVSHQPAIARIADQVLELTPGTAGEPQILRGAPTGPSADTKG